MRRFSEMLSQRLPFFYGYVMVIVAVLAQICSSPGQTFAISAFTPYIQESLGLSASRLSAAYMLGTFLAAFPLSIIGPISDRFGLRWTTLGVAVALSLACGFIGTANGFSSLLLGFLLLRFLGQGSLTLLSSNIVSMWFRQRLGTVNSVMWAGGALAFAAVPLGLLSAIETLGWRTTYMTLGVLIFVMLVPAIVLLMRNQPEELGLTPDGFKTRPEDLSGTREPAENRLDRHEPRFTLADAVRHATFWILAAGMAMWAMIGTGIIFHALPIFEAQGVERDQSQLLFVTFSASMLVTQVGGGILADRLPMNRLLAVGFALLCAGTLTVPMTSHASGVHLFAILFGAGQGLVLAVSSPMWVRYYGRQHLGKIRGTVWCSTVAGSGCGPFILGAVYDRYGSFEPALWLFAGLLSLLIPLGFFATAPTYPQHDPKPDGI